MPHARAAPRRWQARYQGVVLDIEPSHESEDNREQATREGQRFAAYLGVSLGVDGNGPLRVQKVEPHGRGDQPSAWPQVT